MSKFLIISQVFPPDPAAVGQYFDEAAQALRDAGVEVTVLTANRGYDDPDERFEAFEDRGGVQVRRLPASSFGKGSMPVRIFGQLSFLIQCLWRGLFTRGLTDLLVSTSPPMCSIVAVVVGWLRPAVKIHYWVMDLNPDQAVALEVFGAKHPLVLAMDWLNRRILKRADTVIALDRFMQQRLLKKVIGDGECRSDRSVALDDGAGKATGVSLLRGQLIILPPWPIGQHVEPVLHAENWFRQEQGWDDKFVVMFSGNHSWVHPLTTIIDAAEELREDPRFLFVFIGGGKGKAEVDERIKESEARAQRSEGGDRDSQESATSNQQPTNNILSLPYQPLESIRYSLSAADLHLVSLGDTMSGIVHPCKVYGALSTGRPILALGPKESYLNDLFTEGDFGWSVAHGDVDGAVQALKQAAALSESERDVMGARGKALIAEKYSRGALLGKFVEAILA